MRRGRIESEIMLASFSSQREQRERADAPRPVFNADDYDAASGIRERDYALENALRRRQIPFEFESLSLRSFQEIKVASQLRILLGSFWSPGFRPYSAFGDAMMGWAEGSWISGCNGRMDILMFLGIRGMP
jgi:hypothetical protein